MVLQNDPVEEEDLIDPLDTIKEQCRNLDSCQKFVRRLEECSERVENSEGTEEDCEEELFDMVHCIDACAAKQIFDKLK